MKAETKELLAVIDSFENTPIMVIGDLILDHYIWGSVNRISPEAPVVVVEMTDEGKRSGGAGNVASNLLALGANVKICGVIGNDDSGRELTGLLENAGADVNSVLVDNARPTTTKTRVIASAQQVVRVDREDTSELSAAHTEAIVSTLISNIDIVKGVVISDYAKGVVTRSLCDRIAQGHNSEQFGLSSLPVLIDPKGPDYRKYKAATIVKPNRKEAIEASGIQIKDKASAVHAGHVLMNIWGSESVLITLGEDGMLLVQGEGEIDSEVEIATVARDVDDVSGAGDTVSAVFLLALGCGAKLVQAAKLANVAAGIVVGEVGTVAVNTAQLRKAVENGGRL